MLDLVVECRPDPGRGQVPERFGPRGFTPRGRMRAVAEVLDHWDGGGTRYFRVRCSDGCLYILRWDRRGDRWHLHFFQR